MAGLYLHTPFCRQKCHYCDFFSAPPTGTDLENWHLHLNRNLELIALDQPSSLDSIFFGGGTPSLLTPRQIESILACCNDLFDVHKDAEISIEANPGTLDVRSLQAYLEAGINRLSLGIQSFDDNFLQLLGRKHSAEEAKTTFALARDLGYANISLDLIFALPGQSLSELTQDVEALLELSPDHVGVYGLSIEEGTLFAQWAQSGRLNEADEDSYAESYLLLDRLLESAGYEHYEISNFARPGFRCKHNQTYWQRRTCLAAGAGAHGFDARGFGHRTAIPADLTRYYQRLEAGFDPAEPLETFNKQQAMAETIYLALRTRDGICRSAFAQRFGLLPEEAFPKAFLALKSQLQREKDRWFFPVESWLLYDHLVSHFL